MKTKTILVLLMALPLLACGSKEKHTLEFNLNKGEVYSYTMQSDVSTTQSMMGQEMTTGIKMNAKTHYDVTDVQGDVYSLNMFYDAMRMEMNTDMGAMGGTQNIVIDSETAAETVTPDNPGAIFKAMTKVPFSITITKKGEVKSAEGFESMTEEMIAAMGEDMDAQSMAEAQANLTEQFNSDAVKAAIEQMASYFPENPVSIGESWNKTTSIKSGQFTFNLDMKYTLQSIEDNIAVLKMDGTLNVPEESAKLDMQGMEATLTLSGTQTGTMNVDMNTGWTTQMDAVQDLTGNIGVMGMAIPMTMTSKTTMSAVK
jgi:hypothetical protein